MLSNSFKNISVSTIITVIMFLAAVVGGIWNASQIYAEIKNQNDIIEKEIEGRKKENDELKSEILLLRKANDDLEERVDDLEESRAYQEGRMASERTK